MEWLKHAFAVDTDDDAEPTAEQRAVVEKLCRRIVRRHLTTPALAFLEMVRPLNYLGAQTLYFFAPLISAATASTGHQHLAAFLERRGSIDVICRRIEELEAEAETRSRAEER